MKIWTSSEDMHNSLQTTPVIVENSALGGGGSVLKKSTDLKF